MDQELVNAFFLFLGIPLVIFFIAKGMKIYRKYRDMYEERDAMMRYQYNQGYTDAKMARTLMCPSWMVVLWRHNLRLPPHDRREEAKRDSWKPWKK